MDWEFLSHFPCSGKELSFRESSIMKGKCPPGKADCSKQALRAACITNNDRLGLVLRLLNCKPLKDRAGLIYARHRMSQLAQPVQLPQARLSPTLENAAFWRVLVLIGLVLWLYGAVLARLAHQWWTDPNFSHGFFVPIFSLYIIWEKRDSLKMVPSAPSAWGLATMLLSLGTLILGVLGAELFLSRVSLILLLAGMILFLHGWEMLRALIFPLAILFLMVPIPSIILNQITFPLQILASKLSAWILPFLGVPVLREGNVINLPAMPLEVADACSGIRSLLSLACLAIMYGYLLEKRVGVRIMLALASIPIAVAANALRIVGTGLLVQYWDPEKAEGFFHAFSGWLIFVVSLLMLFAVHRLLFLRGNPREVSA